MQFAPYLKVLVNGQFLVAAVGANSHGIPDLPQV